MSAFDENRADERHFHHSSIIVAKFMSDVSHEGKSYNYSAGGVHFETDFPFFPGTVVHIRRKMCCSGNSDSTQPTHEGFRSVTLAEVKWCRKVFDQNTSSYYSMGVKYFRTD